MPTSSIRHSLRRSDDIHINGKCVKANIRYIRYFNLEEWHVTFRTTYISLHFQHYHCHIHTYTQWILVDEAFLYLYWEFLYWLHLHIQNHPHPTLPLVPAVSVSDLVNTFVRKMCTILFRHLCVQTCVPLNIQTTIWGLIIFSLDLENVTLDVTQENKHPSYQPRVCIAKPFETMRASQGIACRES